MGKPTLEPGERACKFIENLTLCDDYEGKQFQLRDWQRKLVTELFGTLRYDGLRKYKRAFWALSRKSGKTTLVSAIVIYLLFGTKRRNQNIYSASGDRAQAGLIFKAAVSMIRADKTLSKLCKIYEGNVKKIVVPSTGNVFEALSSDAPTKHGLNPSCVIFDELHVFPNTKLHDALVTGFGARRDPLTIYITTAGDNKYSLCYELWQYAEGVLEGVINDESFHAALFQAAPDDDWTCETTWRKALPGLGDFTSLEFIRSECERAKQNPAYEATFKQLYLNLWVEDLDKLWISAESWDACEAPIDWSLYEGRPCYGGLDLSSVRDLSAFVLIFPNEQNSFDVLAYIWAPGESARQRELQDGVPYMKWAKDGHLTMSNEKSINYDSIKDQIIELSERFDIQAIGYDSWSAGYLAQTLEAQGINMLKYGQSFSYMNIPCRMLESYILEATIRHDGNPVLKWNVTNIKLEIKNDIIRPSKSKSRDRIDSGVALVMALGVALGGNNEEQSIYETRGILMI